MTGSRAAAALPPVEVSGAPAWRRYVPLLLPPLALLLPLVVTNPYHLHVVTLIGVYWILVAGLTLVVGYAGQLSVGHVGLLAIGAYAYMILTAKLGLPPLASMAAAGGLGASCGILLGLPSLRLPGFYFAMATLAFSMIVTELLIAQNQLTGGGAGMSAPSFPSPFDTHVGLYLLVAIGGLAVTWLVWNLARQTWGRALIALRDSEVAAVACGIPVFRLKLAAFTLSGLTAGLAGALFAALQSYLTPEAFLFELGMFFFICIIVGGRDNLVGPFLGTVALTLLPEVSAPLAKLGNLLYGILLLGVVLLIPKGFGAAVASLRGSSGSVREPVDIRPDAARLERAVRASRAGGAR